MLLAAAVWCWPGAVSAGIVSVERETGRIGKARTGTIDVLTFRAAPAEANRLSVRFSPEAVTVTDAVPISTGGGCRLLDAARKPMDKNLYHLAPDERKRLGIEQLPATLGEAIELTSESELVLRTFGEHIFNRYVEIKRQEWEDYRVQVTQWELDRYMAVL